MAMNRRRSVTRHPRPQGIAGRIREAFRRSFGRLLVGLGLLLAVVGLLLAGSRWLAASRLPLGRAGSGGAHGGTPVARSTEGRRDGTVEALLAAAGVPAALPSASPDIQSTPGPLPDHIRMPRVGIDTKVVPVGWTGAGLTGQGQSEWHTADFAAGLHIDSAPLGEPGNTVISGHNNIAGSVFRHLAEVAPGDELRLSAGGKDWFYTVERRFIVPEEGASDARRRANAGWIDASPDERVTLVSCYPPWGNSHRVIVVARPRATVTATVRAKVTATATAELPATVYPPSG